MAALKCARCGSPRDTGDNFCRRCGHQLTVDVTPARSSLPAVQASRLPARTQSIPPSLVGSVAVLAVGTSIEWLARRFGGVAARTAARAATRAAGRALIGGSQRPATRQAHPVETVVDELIYVRKIELRR